VTINDGSPIAALGTPEKITGTSANVRGTVNPNGRETNFSFQYGLTTEYGQATLPVGFPADNVPLPAGVGIRKLTPNTLYHYRLVATSAAGSGASADSTFRTGPALAITGLPKKGCTKARRLTVTVKATSADKVTETALKLDGAKFASANGKRFKVKLRPRKLKPGRHKLAATATTATSQSTKRAGFRVCR
jgi:hypothetical protein